MSGPPKTGAHRLGGYCHGPWCPSARMPVGSQCVTQREQRGVWGRTPHPHPRHQGLGRWAGLPRPRPQQRLSPPGHTDDSSRAPSGGLLTIRGAGSAVLGRLPEGGVRPGLVAVVLQLVEGANAGAALLHDAALLRGPLQGPGLQAAGTGASPQLRGPHCGERRSGRRRSPAHPARPWSGTPNRCPGAHHGPPPPHGPPRTGPSPRVTGRLPQAPPSPTHHPETIGAQALTHFRRVLPGAALGGEGREWGPGAGRGRGEKGGGEGQAHPQASSWLTPRELVTFRM